MIRFRTNAPAKLNLDLRVLAREESGYHQIETLLLLVDLCDVLTLVETAEDTTLDVVGAEVGPVKENLVLRAADAFLHETGISAGVHFQLEKRIPAGAGLGGGSSDAAAALRLLNKLFDRPLGLRDLSEIGATLGADVPFFLIESGFALGWGRGVRLLELPAPPPRTAVIALPGIHVSTPAAYQAISKAGLDPGQPRRIVQSDLSDWDHLAEGSANNFEAVVFDDHPVLSEVRTTLLDQGAVLARMSGSGSSVFGIFEDSVVAAEVADRVRVSCDCDCVAVPTRSGWADIEAVEG